MLRLPQSRVRGTEIHGRRRGGRQPVSAAGRKPAFCLIWARQDPRTKGLFWGERRLNPAAEPLSGAGGSHRFSPHLRQLRFR